MKLLEKEGEHTTQVCLSTKGSEARKAAEGQGGWPWAFAMLCTATHPANCHSSLLPQACPRTALSSGTDLGIVSSRPPCLC